MSYTLNHVPPNPAGLKIFGDMSTGIDVADIVTWYDELRSERNPLIEQGRIVRDHYNGDIAVPVPGLNEDQAVAVANFFAQGIDQHGMRIASTPPNVDYEPLRKGSKRSDDFARIRRNATLGWLEENMIEIKMGRRARWLITYSCSPVIIRPNRKLGIPRWELRDPLSAFPGKTIDPDDMEPPFVIFDMQRSYDWIQRNYPDEASRLQRERNCSPNTMFTCLEYMDENEIILVVVGDRTHPGTVAGIRGRQSYIPTGGWAGTDWVIELQRTPNRAGICPAVVPGRITLDRPQGQFDSMVGIFQQQALLMALEVNAIAQGVYQNQWLVSRPGEQAQVIREADGLHGVTGIVEGGDIKTIAENPSYMTFGAIDRLTEAQRQNGMIPAQVTGQTPTNIRTGKLGDSVVSAVIDFPIQEAHKIFARSMRNEIRRAIAIEKAYFGNRSLSFYVSWKGAKGTTEYVPNKHFENDNVAVSYPHAGLDAQQLTIEISQLVGGDFMSHQTGRELHPHIHDPELEKDRIVAEGLERAFLASLQQKAQAGELDLDALAVMTDEVLMNKAELYKAYQNANQKAKELQASSGAPGEPTGPVEPGAPEAQPGLAAGTPAAAQAQAPTVGPTPDQAGLAQLFGALRRTATPITSGRGAA